MSKKSKPITKSVIISKNKDTIATVGNKNVIKVSQELKKNETIPAKIDDATWQKVLSELEKLHEAIRNLPTKHEVIRDQELLPTVSKAKSEVKNIPNDAEAHKRGFIEKFKELCDISTKVVDIGTKVAPFITTISKLIGLPF